VTRPSPQRPSPDGGSRAAGFFKQLVAWPLAVFIVVFEVFGTMIMFLVIIGLVVLAGWLLMTLT